MRTAMILAAGSGQRMGTLGQTIPKALLPVAGKPLIGYHLERLAKAGITTVIINLAHLGEQIRETLGNGEAYGITIRYSQEGPGGLETGGGIFHALPLLGPEPFVVINSDIWTDFSVSLLPLSLSGLAHLVLVDNPPHNPEGDFPLLKDNMKLTFSGIGLYHPKLFDSSVGGRFRLGPLLHQALTENKLTAQYYPGQWYDIGTPERYEELLKLI